MKLKSKLGLSFLMMLFGFTAFAQQTGPRVLSLEESISYAIENNVTVKNQRLELGIAKTQVGETMAQGLPQINANGDFTYNYKLQTSFIDAGNFGGQEGTYTAVQFGLPYQSSASITLNQLLFNGSYFVGLKAAKVLKELTEKNVQKAEVDVAEAVAQAYYGTLVADERLELLKNNLDRLDSLYIETQAMQEAGFAEAIAVQRVKVNLNNIRTEYHNVQRSLAINKNMLKFLLGIPLDEEIVLKESIEDFDLENEVFLVDGFDYRNRVEYQQLLVNRELAELDIKNNKVQYLPTLNAFASYGYNAAKSTFGELFEPTTLTEVRRNGDQTDTVSFQVPTWNDYGAVGLRLNVPIFDGFAKANRIRRAKLKREQVENQIRNLENSIDMEIEQARINLINSLQSLEVQKENMELAQEVYRISKIKYQEGVGSNLEIIEAENTYKTAETNYFNALYNALVARTAYQKATGTLYTK